MTVRTLTLSLLLSLSTGCGESALATATRTANAVKAAGMAADLVLQVECIDAIKALPSKADEEKARSRAELAEIQPLCDELSRAYRIERLSHAALLGAIAAAGATADPLLLTRRVLEAGRAAERLGQAAASVRDRR